eukprot:TRINITY_DN6412_c0_g1_i6.p1 TRINITY_DN6412_c0_g1~~TRINITY_DN6412_c0_g1_i6.p1  ORF type:complete len:496 (-),score=-5.81 TRINITY_DN6412_c0_g1_i6:58-1545(-)
MSEQFIILQQKNFFKFVDFQIYLQYIAILKILQSILFNHQIIYSWFYLNRTKQIQIIFQIKHLYKKIKNKYLYLIYIISQINQKMNHYQNYYSIPTPKTKQISKLPNIILLKIFQLVQKNCPDQYFSNFRLVCKKIKNIINLQINALSYIAMSPNIFLNAINIYPNINFLDFSQVPININQEIINDFLHRCESFQEVKILANLKRIKILCSRDCHYQNVLLKILPIQIEEIELLIDNNFFFRYPEQQYKCKNKLNEIFSAILNQSQKLRKLTITGTSYFFEDRIQFKQSLFKSIICKFTNLEQLHFGQGVDVNFHLLKLLKNFQKLKNITLVQMHASPKMTETDYLELFQQFPQLSQLSLVDKNTNYFYKFKDIDILAGGLIICPQIQYLDLYVYACNENYINIVQQLCLCKKQVLVAVSPTWENRQEQLLSKLSVNITHLYQGFNFLQTFFKNFYLAGLCFLQVGIQAVNYQELGVIQKNCPNLQQVYRQEDLY